MNVLLIWPYGFETKHVLPLSLGYLKSNTNIVDVNIDILDCSLLKINSESKELKEHIINYNPDIVGISCWSHTYIEALNVIKLTKEINKNIITVMGGIHPTIYTDNIMKNPEVDFIIRGEGELSFGEFVKNIQQKDNDYAGVSGLVYRTGSGEIHKNEIEFLDDLDKINFPDYSSIRLQDYMEQGYKYRAFNRKNAPVWATRGCPYSCNYCSAPIVNGKKIRKHSPEYLINWIKYLYNEENIRQINIVDDNFTFNVEYAKEVCRKIIDLNYKNLYMGTPNGIRAQRVDDELLQLMKKANWDHICVAPESGSKRVLELMKKNLDPDTMLEKIRQIKKAKLRVHGFFMLGFPGETPEDIKLTIKMLRKCNLNFFFLVNFQPLPGTPIYDGLLEKGEIDEEMLPEGFSEGKRSYTPKELSHINFPALILKEYIIFVLKNPLNLFYTMRFFDFKLLIIKVLSNLKHTVFNLKN